MKTKVTKDLLSIKAVNPNPIILYIGLRIKSPIYCDNTVLLYQRLGIILKKDLPL